MTISFQPKSAASANWGSIQIFDFVVKKFFSPNDGSTSLVKVAREIYDDKTSKFADDPSRLGRFNQIVLGELDQYY